LSSREITQEQLMSGNWSQTNSFGKQGIAFECWAKQYSEFSISLLFSWRTPWENKHCTDTSSWVWEYHGKHKYRGSNTVIFHFILTLR